MGLAHMCCPAPWQIRFYPIRYPPNRTLAAIPAKVATKAPASVPPGLFHLYRHKIDTHGIKNGFTAAHHDGGNDPNPGICPKLLIQIH